ncbi:AAA family ATPase [Amphritea sp. 2_MG-2023]|uniref:AAA family ATPase n=1 Tax=Amphritea TaxID=515417 RepID=UPI001C06667E|nr:MULTISPECIES: AAA family ATPase [Amphritea]MBU2967225.1 ATP-dependent RecD-like DNA helicase [Amphritea atlantica]MDO6420642.1 AAA family ATPase [Amphritea sp. 2_MG-2023]
MSCQELSSHTEKLRVTSHLQRQQDTLIKGVPIDDATQLKSARYVVQIWVDSDNLPVIPAPGQIWTVTGVCEVIQVDVGDFIRDIHQYSHPESLDFELPNDGEVFIQFIAKDPEFKGIGESKARELWHRFGINIHEMLQEQGAKYLSDLREVLSDKSIKALYAGYKKYQNLEHTIWMAKAGVPASIQRRVLKYHKAGTLEELKINPYELVNFGMSVLKVDQLVRTAGSPWTENYSDQRVIAAAVQGLRDCFSDGSTYTNSSKLNTKIFNILKNAETTKQAVDYLKANQNVAIYHESEDRYHPMATAIQELAVAKRFKHLASHSRQWNKQDEISLNSVLGKLSLSLTDRQIEAVRNLLVNQIGCLTGGAGTGKTFTCNTFLKTADLLGYEVHAVALSGRAAMRLHESIGYLTKTIARFLRDAPVECSQGGKRLLLIDEASMVDLPTMFKIINHISPEVKIVFTGDPNQLPPIGIGKILHDLVKCDQVVNTTLDIVKRQEGSSGIPEYTESIKNGLVPDELSTGNIYFHEMGSDQFENTVIELFGESPESTRVIASTRKTTRSINESIQRSFNAESPKMEFLLGTENYFLNLRLGDQVLFTQNNYQAGVQNGTLGKLIDVTQTQNHLGLVRTDTGDLVEVTEGLLDAIELGYAITLHKAQGSQFPRIIVVLEDNRITDRSWLYTAITRAELEVHIIGSAATLKKVTIAPAKAFKRKTLLTELIEFSA